MNKKIVILVIFLVIVLLLLLLLIFSNRASRQNSQNPSIPTFSTPSPLSTSPVNVQTLKQQQDAWAQSQSQYNQQNPWHSKLPLESNDYFISYDPTNDSFIATIYYSSSSSTPADQQIKSLKAEAANTIKALDPSLASKPVSFIPTPLTPDQ